MRTIRYLLAQACLFLGALSSLAADLIPVDPGGQILAYQVSFIYTPSTQSNDGATIRIMTPAQSEVLRFHATGGSGVGMECVDQEGQAISGYLSALTHPEIPDCVLITGRILSKSPPKEVKIRYDGGIIWHYVDTGVLPNTIEITEGETRAEVYGLQGIFPTIAYEVQRATTLDISYSSDQVKWLPYRGSFRKKKFDFVVAPHHLGGEKKVWLRFDVFNGFRHYRYDYKLSDSFMVKLEVHRAKSKAK